MRSKEASTKTNRPTGGSHPHAVRRSPTPNYSTEKLASGPAGREQTLEGRQQEQNQQKLIHQHINGREERECQFPWRTPTSAQKDDRSITNRIRKERHSIALSTTPR